MLVWWRRQPLGATMPRQSASAWARDMAVDETRLRSSAITYIVTELLCYTVALRSCASLLSPPGARLSCDCGVIRLMAAAVELVTSRARHSQQALLLQRMWNQFEQTQPVQAENCGYTETLIRACSNQAWANQATSVVWYSLPHHLAYVQCHCC